MNFKSENKEPFVKVIPFRSISKTQSNYSGHNSLNRIMDFIQESELSFRDEILSALSGKIYPVQSYINFESFVIVGHGNCFAYKNLANLCCKSKQWNYCLKKYSHVKDEN